MPRPQDVQFAAVPRDPDRDAAVADVVHPKTRDALVLATAVGQVTVRCDGVVLEVRDDAFDARLVDLDGDGADIEATFAIEHVAPEDVSLVRVGAFFTWTMRPRDETEAVVSAFRFLKYPLMGATDVAEAEREAHQVRRELGLE